MRSYLSDPILVKPSTSEFLKKWTGVIEHVDKLLLVPQIHKGIDQDYENLTPREKLRQERKLRRRLRRQESMLMANQKVVENELSIRRNSAPELPNLDGSPNTKRVVFAFKPEDRMPPVELKIGNEPVQPRPKRPILSKKNRTVSLPLDHMDFDAFTAFKRATKMRNEAMECYAPPPPKKQNPNSWSSWSSPSFYLKSALLGCFYSKQNKTHPHRNMVVFVLNPSK